MVARVNSVDMTHGSLWNKILKFSLLFMLTAIIQQLYNAADTVVVGRYAGEDALAGVGTCGSLITLFINFILGFSAGVTIVLGQAIGEKSGQIEKVTHTAFAIALCGGFIISAICLTFTKGLLTLTGVPENIMPEASSYLSIRAIGFIPCLIYNFGAGILRAKGDTKRPLYIITISGIINVGLNLLFVCVFKMAAGGVALATVISQFYTAIVILYILTHEVDATKISLNKIRFYKEPFLKILRYGLPSGVQSSVYSVSNILVQSSINSFGATAIAGSAAVASITTFYDVMNSSLYQASVVFTSQNYGAKNFDRIKRTLFICVGYVLAVELIQSSITFFLGETLVGLYAPNNPAVIEMAMRKFKVVGYFYGILALMNVMSGALRGMGASFINMVTSIIGVCGIRIMWIMTAFKAIGTFESLYVCYPLSWIGTTCLHIIMFLFVFKKLKNKHLANSASTLEV